MFAFELSASSYAEPFFCTGVGFYFRHMVGGYFFLAIGTIVIFALVVGEHGDWSANDDGCLILRPSLRRPALMASDQAALIVHGLPKGLLSYSIFMM